MIVKSKPKRYKITCGIDTHLSKKQILKLLDAFECFMIQVEDAK